MTEVCLKNECMHLFSLVFGFIVQHPYEHIKRVLANAQIASQGKQKTFDFYKVNDRKKFLSF